MAGVRAVRSEAERVGVYVDTYSPGDGVTRYQFDHEQENYFAMRGIYTALGAAEAMAWLAGYAEGRERAIPAPSTPRRLLIERV